MKNVTVTVGRDAILTCIVENLSTFKASYKMNDDCVRSLRLYFTLIFPFFPDRLAKSRYANHTNDTESRNNEKSSHSCCE